MLHNVNRLKKFTLHATDGDIGRVKDVYFDDEQWVVRYLVVETGGWLTGRQVLLSPMSFGHLDWKGKSLHTNLTRAQIENSPGINAHIPISRQQEIEYVRHFGYPYYWTGPYAWGKQVQPSVLDEVDKLDKGPDREQARQEYESARQEDSHLRSCDDVHGYAIAALDGKLGHIVDFLFDEEDWSIQYLVADPRNLWPSKHVLIMPQRIENVDWASKSVVTNLTREEIENGPEYDPDNPPPSPAHQMRPSGAAGSASHPPGT